MQLPLLSCLIFIPIIGGIICLCFPQRNNRIVKSFAIVLSIISMALSIYLLDHFEQSTVSMQWSEIAPWMPVLNIYYHVGVDALSLALIGLSSLINLFVVLFIASKTMEKSNHYLAAFLMMQGFICGAFAAVDAILFYTFWEASLIPLFLVIGIWGGENRRYASMKFFLYTLAGSIFLLLAILYLHHKTLGFNIMDFQALRLDFHSQCWLFLGFLLAFGIKLPLWPVHTWLPDAHVEAPTAGSMLLAAIVLKMGAYGFLRFILPIVPDASRFFAPSMIVLSLIAIIYIAVVALAQRDLKKLIAYSSISHMGFVTLGIFSSYLIIAPTILDAYPTLGLQGSVIQLFSHAFISAALFLCIGLLYERTHTRLINDYAGIAKPMPVFSSYFMLFVLANSGLPGTSGFVAEFFVILSVFKAKIIYAIIASLSLVLSACYGLRMIKKVVWGPVKKGMEHLEDVQGIDKIVLLLFAFFILVIGLCPNKILNFMQSFLDRLLVQMLASKI